MSRNYKNAGIIKLTYASGRTEEHWVNKLDGVKAQELMKDFRTAQLMGAIKAIEILPETKAAA